jgi:hypothetical protein
MKISTIKNTMLSVALVAFSLGFVIDAQAQYKAYGDNIIFNGDFSLGDSLWVIEGGNGTVSHSDTLKFEGVTAGDPWALQSYQSLTAEQIAALAEGGDWELTFDAMSPSGAKNFHVFLGEVGGGWARYWTSEGAGGSGPGDVVVDGEWKTYSLNTFITQTWDAMKIGFEVAGDGADLMIDNVKLRTVKNNVVMNGDFSQVDSSGALVGWSGGTAVNGEMHFADIPGTGNQYDVQSMQLFSQEQLDSIYAPGPYEFSFEARTSEGTQDLYLYFGENGGGWARYFGADARMTVDTEMKKYTIESAITDLWDVMQVGFEVNFAAGDLYIDNMVVSRISEVAPDAPAVALSTDAGMVTIDVTDNGAASYAVYFADSAFTDISGGTLVATLSGSELSATHTVKAPHASMVKTFDAYYGVVALTAKGSASEMTASSINTATSVASNYIYELSAEAVEAAAGALETGVVPPATALASFFPDDYTPFEINSNSLTVEGNAPEGGDADASAKFWMGFENITGANMMVFYAEIMDDIVVPADAADNGGGGWAFDSWEAGIGAYGPEDYVAGSDHQSFESGEEPDYQLRAGLMNVNGPYIHGWDGDAGDPGFNQLVGNSATVADTSADGMVRLLTILSTVEFSGVNTAAADFVYPTGEGVSTMMFNLAINDNDGTSRDYQGCWSSKCTSAWWNTPANWEVVALVGSAAVVSNEDVVSTTPIEYSLDQNYPNPFNPSTNIQFSLAATSDVTLEVYNMLGQKVATLLQNQKMNAGSHTQTFDASRLASGMYVYRISTPNFVQSRSMMLIK